MIQPEEEWDSLGYLALWQQYMKGPYNPNELPDRDDDRMWFMVSHMRTYELKFAFHVGADIHSLV